MLVLFCVFALVSFTYKMQKQGVLYLGDAFPPHFHHPVLVKLYFRSEKVGADLLCQHDEYGGAQTVRAAGGKSLMFLFVCLFQQ